MPSPIAHTAIALLTWPTVNRAGLLSISQPRRWALFGLLLFTLCAPDLDILFTMLMGEAAFKYHGGAMHSLAAGFVWAWVFAGIGYVIVRGAFARLWIVGLAAYWSHVIMDALTRGRGVMMLWPWEQRIGLPDGWYLFVGVEHSNPWDWQHHLLTVGNELVFAAIVGWIAMRLFRKRNSADTIRQDQAAIDGVTRS